MTIFDPPQNPQPLTLTDHQKLLQMITSATPTALPNLVPIGGRLGIFKAEKPFSQCPPQRDSAYTRYKYRSKKSTNGVGIKTPLQRRQEMLV